MAGARLSAPATCEVFFALQLSRRLFSVLLFYLFSRVTFFLASSSSLLFLFRMSFPLFFFFPIYLIWHFFFFKKGRLLSTRVFYLLGYRTARRLLLISWKGPCIGSVSCCCAQVSSYTKNNQVFCLFFFFFFLGMVSCNFANWISCTKSGGHHIGNRCCRFPLLRSSVFFFLLLPLAIHHYTSLVFLYMVQTNCGQLRSVCQSRLKAQLLHTAQTSVRFRRTHAPTSTGKSGELKV